MLFSLSLCAGELAKFTVAEPRTRLVTRLCDAVGVQQDSIARLEGELPRWIGSVREQPQHQSALVQLDDFAR